MKIVLLGPTLTSAYRDIMGLSLEGAPNGTGQTPIAPLAAGLRKLGHEVHVITTDPTVDDLTTCFEDGFSITYCPVRGEPRYRARVRSADMFEREIRFMVTAIKNAAPDIVHAHWTYEFAEAALRTRLPHVVTMHDLGWDYLRIFRDPYRAVRLLMKYRAMPRVRNLTVVAPFMAKKTWHYGYFGPADVIPNGLTVPEAIRSLGAVAAVDAPRIFTIGNPGPIKNVSAAIEGFRLIRERRPNAELHLFGPGLDAAYVQGEPGVKGHGNVAHGDLMKRLAEEASLLIHPSRLECCPMIIAEAKVRGVPVVGGQASGGVAYVCSNAGSITTDIEDPVAIAGAADVLLRDPQTYERARAAAREDAEARFDTDKVTQQYLSVYERVLLRARGRRVRS